MDLNFFYTKPSPKCHDYFSADGRRLWASGAGYSLRALNVVFFGVRWIGRRCWRRTEGVGARVDQVHVQEIGSIYARFNHVLVEEEHTVVVV